MTDEFPGHEGHCTIVGWVQTKHSHTGEWTQIPAIASFPFERIAFWVEEDCKKAIWRLVRRWELHEAKEWLRFDNKQYKIDHLNREHAR